MTVSPKSRAPAANKRAVIQKVIAKMQQAVRSRIVKFLQKELKASSQMAFSVAKTYLRGFKFEALKKTYYGKLDTRKIIALYQTMGRGRSRGTGSSNSSNNNNNSQHSVGPTRRTSGGTSSATIADLRKIKSKAQAQKLAKSKAKAQALSPKSRISVNAVGNGSGSGSGNGKVRVNINRPPPGLSPQQQQRRQLQLLYVLLFFFFFFFFC